MGGHTENMAISPDELVRVTSCLDVPRADLARLALAREGIPSALGNANFLSWFWHYSNAVGGVTVHVRRFEPSSRSEPQPQGSAEPSDLSSHHLSTTRSEISRAIVRRAWQAAVIALAFPPLGFYSMRLLWKLVQRDTPLSRIDNGRFWMAFFLNICHDPVLSRICRAHAECIP
jgi:hypothetical protein